ncbi:MAG: Nif11-like leader peptide family RiPP precursor [Actinomycetes bacterium]
MSREQWDALGTATADNDELRADLAAAKTREDFVRIANSHGFEVLAEDLPPADEDEDLSDAELELASGGTMPGPPRSHWLYCDNWATDSYCTRLC